jgi:hypothetical protein
VWFYILTMIFIPLAVAWVSMCIDQAAREAALLDDSEEDEEADATAIGAVSRWSAWREVGNG